VALDSAFTLRGAFTENVNLKLLSFGFALILYSLVHGSQDWQRSVRVAVDTRVPPEAADRVLVTRIPPEVRVTLRGPQSVVEDLKTDDFGSVQLDLHDGTQTRVVFTPQMFHFPAGVKVEQIDPPAIDLSYDERVVRDVPVQVSVAGTPAPGFVVKNVPVADPASVRARGPKSDVMVLQHARAEAFDVTGLTEGRYTRTLAIDRPRDDVTYSMASVQVSLEIAREVAERPFTKIPVAVVGQLKARTQPAEVDVRLTCPPEILRGLRPEQIVPRVQVTSAAEHGSVALPVQLSIDKCDVQITPSTVVVRWGQ
jgi:YbbR domain-containing protein